MQSVCLKEFGAKGKIAEETTLIGLTFGGYLRSKVVHYFDGTSIITFLSDLVCFIEVLFIPFVIGIQLLGFSD